eukprot:Clim_evm2s24 gene=Clim_evmTU2s24
MSSDIANLQTFDPFADAEPEVTGGKQGNFVHIRLQQRNNRKYLTTIQGIGKEFDLSKLVKAFKKDFACNGTVVQHSEYGEVIQLQGDQRQKAQEFIVGEGIAKKGNVKVHGF